MKLTTLNLQGFTDWNDRQPEIIAYLEATKPDVIFFQEVVFIPSVSPYNQMQLLNKELGYSFEHSAVTRLQVGAQYPVFREGLAILSNYPVISTDTIVLQKAEGDEHDRIAQLIDIDLNGTVIKLANVHFSLSDTVDYATAHLTETLGVLTARGEERIIAGDFNLDHLEESVDVWGDRYQATTNVPYVSFPAMNKRNDYMLVPKAYNFSDPVVSGDELSDHRAVTIEIDAV